MTAGEQGFLLLTSCLGDPERKPLTIAQFRDLTKRARMMERPVEDRELSKEDLLAIGCSREAADRIVKLLSQSEQLRWYLEEARKAACVAVTRVSADYPSRLRHCLGLDSPGVLWTKGDLSILKRPAVSLVGSRDLYPENQDFACAVGEYAARQGYVLVSGHARGADRAAQDSCLKMGGCVISVVSDELEAHSLQERILYMAEESFDSAFSAQRALQRNRLIHSLGQKTFVAQCALGKGGTWSGTTQNLRYGWSDVFCFDDGTEASRELSQMGATLIKTQQLSDFSALESGTVRFMEI